jgi:hypothetical protein
MAEEFQRYFWQLSFFFLQGSFSQKTHLEDPNAKVLAIFKMSEKSLLINDFDQKSGLDG